jgi:hypothetical protein
MNIVPNQEQNDIVNAIKDYNIIVDSIAGAGKCHAIDTPIIMFDGSIKMVQDIKVGDQLMGDDSTPRNVLSLARGQDIMYEIVPEKGEVYTFNSEHILCLKYNNQIYDIPINKFLKMDKNFQEKLQLYKVPLDFPYKEIQKDPYESGKELALKSFEFTNKNERIHEVFRINTKSIRMEFLAGILDSIGIIGDDFYKFYYNNRNLANDICFLIRSLGFDCYLNKINHYNLHKISIKGKLSDIPIRKPNFPKDSDNNLLMNFSVVEKEIGDYYGFELDGNHKYLLEDFTVTHNTSTVLFIKEKYPEKNILVLTYNSFLKLETRKRSEHLLGIDVHSYHSFCVANYDKSAYTDDKVNELVVKNKEPMNYFSYDIIIADESQDITPLLYRLLSKILSDNMTNETCKIAIIGDKMQSIYKFREADSRFITLSDKLFNGHNNYDWKKMNLSETFRCSIPMVNFINKCMIGYERLHSKKQSKIKPMYVVCNTYSYPTTIIKELLKKYKPNEIFVLGLSIKEKTPIKNLANYVTNNLNIPIYCSGSDSESLDSRIIENKLVFTTVHQSKGLERKAVIFIGFDESYFEYYDKVSEKTICPNELYVAVTRASESLVLIHDYKKNYLPFLNIDLLKKYTDFTVVQTKDPRKNNYSVQNNYTVTDLISYLPFSVENLCMNCITVKMLNEPEEKLNIQSVIKIDKKYDNTDHIYESVSDITGIAIPANFEYKRLGKSSLFSKNLVEKQISIIENGNQKEEIKISMITKLKKFSKTIKDFHTQFIEKIDIKNMNTSDLLKISLYYSAQQNKTDYKLKQITEFDWLTKAILDEGTERLSQKIKGTDLIFEEFVQTMYNDITVMGEIDCIDTANKIVYEFKCTSNLSSGHLIQLAIYHYIHSKIFKETGYRFILFNILTNECREIEVDKEGLESIIKILIEHKISNKIDKTDEQFLLDFGNLKINSV